MKCREKYELRFINTFVRNNKETIAVYEYPFYYSYLRIIRQFEFDKSEL